MNNEHLEALRKRIRSANRVKERMEIVAVYAKEMVGADRFSLFIYDREKDRLKSLYADGIGGSLSLRSNVGIAGYAFHKRVTVIENDTAKNPYFLAAVDRKSGYRTKSVLTVPVVERKRQRAIGVIQLLNKNGGFSKSDGVIVEEIAAFVAEREMCGALFTTDEVQEESENRHQERLDAYLSDKKLYFLEDGNVYYKIVGLERPYFIGADKCYRLETQPQQMTLYYMSVTEELYGEEAAVFLHRDMQGVFVRPLREKAEATLCSFECD